MEEERLRNNKEFGWNVEWIVVEGDVVVEESKGDVMKGCVSNVNELGFCIVKKKMMLKKI